MADATRPSSFDFAIDEIDVVYQDIAQRGQASILTRNIEHFGAHYGMLALKSRSENVSIKPSMVYRKARDTLRSGGFRILDFLPLDPHEKDHAMVVVKRL